MVSVSDLRKGNMIMHKGLVVEVITINETYAVARNWNDDLVICRYDAADPVLLTDDLYSILGFERTNFSWAKGKFILFDYSSSNKVGSVIVLSMHINCPCIQYLHQLQNLYYSLAGHELSIEGWGHKAALTA
jgi:hypothetical protein